MRSTAGTGFVAALAFVAAAGVLGPYVQTSHVEPKRRAASNTTLEVLFGLVQHNIGEVYDELRRVSDPTMPSTYQQYRTLAEIRSLVAPSEEEIERIMEYFESLLPEDANVHLAKSGDFVSLTSTVGVFENAFATEIYEFGSDHFKGSTIAFRATKQLHIPSSVSSLIEFVSLAAPVHDIRATSATAQGGDEFVYFRRREDYSSARMPPVVNPFKVRAAGGVATVTALPFCADGKPNLAVDNTTSVEEPCRRQGSDPIVSFNFRIYQAGRPVKFQTVEFSNKRLVLCKLGTVLPTVNCEAVDLTIVGLDKFRKTQISIQSQTKSGQLSDWTNVDEVEPFWSNPLTTPQMLAELYGIPLHDESSTGEGSVAIVEFLEQYYNDQDLAHFLKSSGCPRSEISKIVGPNDPNYRGGEAQLDVQYLSALAGGNSTISFWSVPGRNPKTNDEPFLRWIFQLVDIEDESLIPMVHTVSYGDHESKMQEWYARRLDLEFAKLGLRGLTVIVSSGDGGAIMADEDSESEASQSCDVTRVSVPASMPSVTTVGATQLSDEPSLICGVKVDGMPVVCEEVAEKSCDVRTGGVITSGGGFSNLFLRPWYQSKSLERYLTNPDTPLPANDMNLFFNPKGRGFPDVSVYGNNFLVFDGKGGWKISHGTSASAPVFAAMVARWNKIFLKRGLPSLGFINPLLYHIAERHPEAFNDILVGDNRCGTNAKKCCPTGFSASRGWDAVTGLGSPKFPLVAEYLEKLANEILKKRNEVIESLSVM